MGGSLHFTAATRKTTAICALVLGLAASTAWAQSVDEVVVTGSHIKQSPEDAPVPIDVVNSEDLFNIGSPSTVELVKTLGVSSGTDGETNQFASNGLEGTANINLRGLGAGRNLVLLNGKRNVWSPGAIAEQQQLFVDINMIPGVAINRVELLKDGAAATYGSDAISGVVNFITRNDFEGLEVAVSHKEIDGSDGDQDLGLIWGQQMGATHLMAAVGYNKRNKLEARERDWAIQPRFFQGNTKAYTGIGNPGSYIPVGVSDAGAISRVQNDDGVNLPGVRDARCADFIGEASAALRASANCTYNYVYFDNLIEEEERTNLFSVLTHEFDDDMSLSVEFLYGKNEVPDWNTSPSYPPQVLVDTNPVTGRIIPSYHPGLAAYVEDHDDGVRTHFNTDDIDENCVPTSRDDTSCAAFMFFGRPFGVSGPPNTGFREYETTKLSVGLEGTLDNDIDYTTSVVLSSAERNGTSPDTYIERWSLALKGFGGPNCTGDTPGENGCEFYNPFSNAIQTPQAKHRKISVNPDYDPALANSESLRKWMQYDLGTTITSELTVWDGVLTGELNNGIGWAVGAQYREEAYEIDVYDGNDLHVNPCVTAEENRDWRAENDVNALCNRGTTTTADDYEGSGQFGFLAGATPLDEEQDIMALFGELALSPTDNLEVQLSARYEDYGGDVGDSFDPKIAVRYQANNNLVVRGSASSTFRGPTLNQLGGRSTTLSFVGATGSFKAIDTFGNPDLDPESAITANLGVVFETEPNFTGGDAFTASVDYWSFDFQDPIIKQSFGDIINRSFDGNGNYTGGAFGTQVSCGFGASASCEGEASSAIQRVRVNMVNGPDIETDGFDIRVNYDRPLGNGELSVSAELTLVTSYDVASSALNDELDALNRLNDDVGYLRSVVEEKWKLGAKYSTGPHNVNFVSNFTGSYEDNITAAGPNRDVEDHMTHDLHYNMSLVAVNPDLEDSTIWVSIYNLTDEDPPFARLDLNYDPYTHNPFGQMIKIGVRHKF